MESLKKIEPFEVQLLCRVGPDEWTARRDTFFHQRGGGGGGGGERGGGGEKEEEE